MRSVDRIELAARRALDSRAEARKALAWYAEAWEYCRSLGADAVRVAGAVAALSPMQSWESQLKYTPQILAAFLERVPLPGPGFKKNKQKAVRILAGGDPLEELKGDKVLAFYECIVTGGRTGTVCVDRHAYALAAGPGAGSLTSKRYKDTAAAYVAAAARLRVAYPELEKELTPANVQALCWCWWRDNPGERF